MYYNPTSTSKLDIKQFRLPPYAVNYLNYLLVERNLTPRTIFNYGVSVQTFLRWIQMQCSCEKVEDFGNIDVSMLPISELSELTRNDIYDFLSFCATELDNSASSRAAKLSALKSFFAYLKEKDVKYRISNNPAIEISAPKKEKKLPKFLTLDETKKLLDVVKQGGNARDYCMILWFVTCGMRLTEICSIDVKDVKHHSLADDTYDLKLRGKGRKERIVPLNKQCIEALEQYLPDRTSIVKERNPKETALFLSNRGTRITGRRIEQIVNKYMLMAGLQGGYSPHKLRHTAATLARKYGDADIMDISSMLGHESIATTQIYVHTLEQNRNPTDKLGGILIS